MIDIAKKQHAQEKSSIPVQRPEAFSSSSKTPTTIRNLLPLLILFRICNNFLVQTYFNPDEYWQGPEVAHRMVFGTGHLTWEWSPAARIRSAVHPSVFAVLYSIIKVMGVDTRFVVAHGPRVLQSILASVGDYYVYHWSYKLFQRDTQIANWSLFCSIVSFFNFFCITRTFSNSAETVFTVVALYYWPMDVLVDVHLMKKNDDIVRSTSFASSSSSWWYALSFASIAVLLRPTSLLIWLPLGLRSLWFMKTNVEKGLLMARVVVIGAIALLVWLLVDQWFYGEVTFVLWNFISFNVIHGLDKLYGSHPWHWYLTQGSIVVFGTSIPFAMVGMYQILCKQINGGEFNFERMTLKTRTWSMVFVIFFFIFALSSTSHKEFRFILPLLPIVNVWSGYGIYILSNTHFFSSSKISSKTPSSSSSFSLASSGTASCSCCNIFRNPFGFRCVIVLVVGINVIVGLILSMVHQRGTIDVVNYLATVESQLKHVDGSDVLTSIHFWTPCHATPYTSHLHLHSFSKLSKRKTDTDTNTDLNNEIVASTAVVASSPRLRQLDCSPPIMRSHWCGSAPCQSLLSNILPNQGISQSTWFETNPLLTMQYVYKDLSLTPSKLMKERVLSSKEIDMTPEFESSTGKVIVQWSWGYDPPSHIVIFDSELTIEVKHYLKNVLNCIRVIDFFHSFAQGDMHAKRMRSRIVLWRCGENL